MTIPLKASGAIAVVTGGAGGIGAALCEHLLIKGAAQIVVADRDEARVMQTTQRLRVQSSDAKISPLVLDVADGDAVRRAAADIVALCGRIDLWFSNAGVSLGTGIGDPADWSASIGVNIMAHVHAARYVIPAMAERGDGHFTVTASAAGLLSDFRSAPYSATKHAAVAFAEWLAIRHADEGVGVSCICPEGVKTGMTRESSAKAGSGMEFLDPDEMVARAFLELEQGKFLVLPHARVAEFERRRSGDRERWIAGMSKARRQIVPAGQSANTEYLET
jgi:NAD(P)-dependent dehydrogenase (short-subunit alcohol dehydrogenase family)